MRLIDADALSEWMKDYGQKCIKGERKISLMYVWKHIQDMPTIEERKKGKWKYGVCPECGFSWADITLLHEVPNFCQNCGADMRGK